MNSFDGWSLISLKIRNVSFDQSEILFFIKHKSTFSKENIAVYSRQRVICYTASSIEHRYSQIIKLNFKPRLLMAIGEISYLVIIESLSVAFVGRGRCRRRGDIDVEKSQVASAAKIVGPIVINNIISPIKIQQMVRRRRRKGPKTTTATVLQPAMGHSWFCGVYVYGIV